MTNQKSFIISGGINIPVSITVKGISECEAVKCVIEKINSLSIVLDKLKLEDCEGDIHTLDVHDIEIEWQDAEEE